MHRARPRPASTRFSSLLHAHLAARWPRCARVERGRAIRGLPQPPPVPRASTGPPPAPETPPATAQALSGHVAMLKFRQQGKAPFDLARTASLAPVACGLVAFTGLVALCVGPLACYHCSLVCNNTTTSEDIKEVRVAPFCPPMHLARPATVPFAAPSLARLLFAPSWRCQRESAAMWPAVRLPCQSGVASDHGLAHIAMPSGDLIPPAILPSSHRIPLPPAISSGLAISSISPSPRFARRIATETPSPARCATTATRRAARRASPRSWRRAPSPLSPGVWIHAS